MVEWSGHTVKVESHKGFKKNDFIYIVKNPDAVDVKLMKLKIDYIEFDSNAPHGFSDLTKLICKSTDFNLFNIFRIKKYKLPHHWVGKTKQEAIRNFFKYRDQFKDNKNMLKECNVL